MLAAIAIAAVGISFVVYGLGIASLHRHVRASRAPAYEGPLPALSVLKPIKGEEDELRENLRSFLAQRYPGELEIVFAAADRDDPGLVIAREVAAEHSVRASFVVSDESFGLNPKVANLHGALRAASHDLVLQSDANVRAAPGYLEAIVRELHAKEAALLTSLVAGVGERTPAAAMENLQLDALIAPGMCAALHVLGVDCVVGKSMLFRRSELDALGGLEHVKDVLCEDFVIGRTYGRAGKKIVLSATRIENVNRTTRLAQFLARHSRWLKMRAVLHVPGFIADLFANPIALAIAAAIAWGFAPPALALLGVAIALKVLGDAWLVRIVRGHPMKLAHLALVPVKDLLMLGVFVHAAFSRTVVWRGRTLRFGKDSVLVATTPDSVPASARSEN